MAPYTSPEAWRDALEVLFNPDPADSPADTPETKDARTRAAAAVLYVPGKSEIHMDGRVMDFDSLIASVYRARRANANFGAHVHLTCRDFVRDDTAQPPTVRCTWRMACTDPPAGPPARRPLPPDVDVDVVCILDQTGPDARALHLTAISKAVEESDESPDSD